VKTDQRPILDADLSRSRRRWLAFLSLSACCNHNTLCCSTECSCPLCHRIGSQHFDAELIAATDIMMKIRKHAGTSHGIRNGGHECKVKVIERDKSPGITVGNSRASNARTSVLHENEGQNSGQECSPGHNWATQRLDETDGHRPFFRRQKMMPSESL
jgi:hypothetical protein